MCNYDRFGWMRVAICARLFACWHRLVKFGGIMFVYLWLVKAGGCMCVTIVQLWACGHRLSKLGGRIVLAYSWLVKVGGCVRVTMIHLD